LNDSLLDPLFMLLDALLPEDDLLEDEKEVSALALLFLAPVRKEE